MIRELKKCTMVTVWSVHLSKLPAKHRGGRGKCDWLPLSLSDATSALTWQEVLVNSEMSPEERLYFGFNKNKATRGHPFSLDMAVQAQRGRPAAPWCRIHRDLQPGHTSAPSLPFWASVRTRTRLASWGSTAASRLCCSCLHLQGILRSRVMGKAWRPSRGKEVPSSYLSGKMTFTWDLSDRLNEAVNQ